MNDQLNKCKARLERSLKRAEERIEYLEQRKDNLSPHGHWDLGYFHGKASAYDLAIELIDKILENSGEE